MSVTSFSYTPPADMRGIEDFAPEELQGFIGELVRRDEQRFTSLINAIRNQCIVDTSILPTITSGASDTVSTIVATTQDVEDSEVLTLLYGIE
jgi:hypothetical protein